MATTSSIRQSFDRSDGGTNAHHLQNNFDSNCPVQSCVNYTTKRGARQEFILISSERRWYIDATASIYQFAPLIATWYDSPGNNRKEPEMRLVRIAIWIAITLVLIFLALAFSSPFRDQAKAATSEEVQAVVATMKEIFPGFKVGRSVVTLGSETKPVGLMYKYGQSWGEFTVLFNPGESCGYTILDQDADGIIAESDVAGYACDDGSEPPDRGDDLFARLDDVQAVYDEVIVQARKQKPEQK
jgi:hypothetical protein